MSAVRPGTTNPHHARLREGFIAFGLFILTFAVHAASPVTTSTDSAWTFHVAASILQQGNVDLDEYRPLMDLSLDYRLREINGHVYYYYPVGTPLLIAPAVFLANLVLPALGGSTDFYTYLATHGPNERTAQFEKLLASAFVGLAAVFMYLIARRSQLSPGLAMALTVIFAFGTSMWSTASRALWQHGPSVTLLTAALYLTLSVSQKSWGVFAVGAILAFAYLVRPTNSLSFAFLGLYFWLNARRHIWAYVAGGLIVLFPYMLQNWITYGNAFPPYSYQLFERFGRLPAIAEALVGTLVSPNRGLFVFTPVFLFSLYGAYLSLARRRFNAANLDGFVLGIVVSHWIVTSLFEDWGGAWSIGPRYFVDVIPYLVFLLIPLLKAPIFQRPILLSVFVLASVVGVAIQAHCAISPYPFMWNGKPQALVEAPQRKWDWGDLQFLRGLCPADPLEGRAPACWFEPHG